MFSFFQENIKKILSVTLIIVIASYIALVEAAIENKLTASDGQTSDNFGESVSMTDNYAIVGSPRDDDNGNSSGSAYLFERSGTNWVQDIKITPGDAAAEDFFGCSVNIDGNYAIIGASYKSGQGAAYIFYYDGANWNQQAKLVSGDIALNDMFGDSVAIYGDYAIVGTPSNDDSGFSSGSAYIFKRSGVVWAQIKKLTASDAINGAYFGDTVSIYGDYAIVGAYNADNGGIRSGAAYIFSKNSGGADNWGQIKKLTAGDGAVNDYFGASVDIYGDYAIIGATGDNTTENETGSAYIFYKDQGGVDNWGEFEKLIADDAEFNARMGYSVSISNTRAIVGDWYRNDIGDEDGAIYVYEFIGSSWDNEKKIISSDREIGDSFGISVANTDTYAIAGAEREDEVAVAAGAAYVYFDFACTDVTADFTDANFLTCVSNTLGTPGLVCQEDAAAITALTCNSQSISGIAGTEHLTSLIHFYASDNSISDISPLSGITTLQTLFLDNNSISAISSLAGLTDLRQIWLSNSNISDLSPLSGMSNLYRLVLYGNNISDLSPISGLINMQYLYLNENNISDLSPLTNFTLLNTLHFNNNVVSDFSVLSDKTNLRHLHLNGNDIGDINFLSGLTGLIELRLNGNNIVDLSPLSAMANLTELWLENNDIVDPSTLSDMTNLTDLDLNDNYISDITSLASGNLNIVGFAGGNTIDVDDNPLCDSDDFDEINLLETNGATVNHDPLICGDGTPSTKCAEQCDDGNLVSGDGCSSTCQGEYYGCYMTFVTPPVVISHFNCNNGCQNFGYAGGWSPNSQSCMCYIGNSAMCDAVCTAVDNAYTGSGLTCGFIRCGNGIVEPDGVWPAREQCDDGNLVSGDGCSATCTTEGGGGSSRAPEPPVCSLAPVKIDLPTFIPVTQIGGKVISNLNWSKVITQETNTEQKIQILFDYFSQSKKPVIGENIKTAIKEGKNVENVFAKYIYGEIAKDVELAPLLKNKVGTINYANLAKCDCNDNLASTLVGAVKALRSNNVAKDRINGFIVGFVNDLLAIEDVITQFKSGAATPFTDFYNNYFPSGVYEGLSIEIYRNGNLIHTEENPNNTSYSDDTIPANTSGSIKSYEYLLRTKNSCGDSADGSKGLAEVDPQIPTGVDVQVSLDLSVKVKEAYTQLFMERLKELLMQNNNSSQCEVQEGACEDMRQAFLVEKKNDKMFSYVLECFAGYDCLLRQRLTDMRSDIVQPILRLLSLDEGNTTRESIVEEFINRIIYDLNQRLLLESAFKAELSSLAITAYDIMDKESVSELSESQIAALRNIDERLFEGAGHTADIIIEKYDSDGNLTTYNAHTDVFGMVEGVSIGNMTSGKDYTLKIWLKDPKTGLAQKYVLPHKVTLNIRNAIKTGDKYSTTIALDFPKHFRFGNFDDTAYPGESGSKDVIDWHDVKAWFKLLNQQPELWQSGDLDGRQGINILDVFTLQQNWGNLGETQFGGGSQMSLANLLTILGLTDSLSSGSSLTTQISAPSWLSVVRSTCP